MKRLLAVIVSVLAVGTLATACDGIPPAATVNGTTIATSTLNAQLHVYDQTAAGRCLLERQKGQTAIDLAIEGTGGSGTYDMAFTDSVLENQVGNTLAEQYAASKGLHVSSPGLTVTEQQFEATLNGEVTAAVQQDSQSGTTSYCETSSGQPVTGAQLLGSLPSAVRAAELRNQAVDQKLLADGADLSAKAVSDYYATNKTQFEVDCVSVIVADTEAHATQYIAQINGGASFASVAKANSLDTQTASAGGAIGCTYTQSLIEQDLKMQSLAVNTPIGPIQSTSNQSWDIYEITSQTLEPLSSATSLIRQELLEQTANVNRVSKQIVAFARRSNVSVDPQYGVWKAQAVVAPVAPPAGYLLAAVSGQPAASSSSLGLGGTGSAGTGSTTSGS